MDNKAVVLIVEDDETISNFISAILTSNGYGVQKTSKGKEAMSMASSYCPDIVLLDLGLPDVDGLEVLRTIRIWTDTPVVVVSARGHEREKVEALDAGADDYITKPFGTAELLARIRAAMRRGQRTPGHMESQTITINDLEINFDKRTVTAGGRDIHLTPIEYRIIVLLARHAGKVLTHDFIIREIWGPYTNEIQALRVNMANIRRKLEENPAEPKYIITEVGVGYRMVEDI